MSFCRFSLTTMILLGSDYLLKPIQLPELLSPAGDLTALYAAVNSGADAVYLGYQSFGARASATNFDAEALEKAVKFAHFHHVRIHATMNTLVKQNEFEAAYSALEAISKAGVDAVIVQDIGIASLVKHSFPSLQLHASTQMALCNASGVGFAKQFGFDRVVLSRECSLEDIRKASACGIETEVFVHGALCSAVSGRCLMSSMAGGRSGNRGRCAQPCRQQLSLGTLNGALLSTKDLCLIDDLPALVSSGVHSLKIEGRLKSPEYVAVVTEAYRRALDDIASGSFSPDDPARRNELLQIYNRGGFTRGHAMGDEDASLCAAARSSHDGVALGTVLSQRGNLAAIHVQRDLNDGDTLQIRSDQDIDLRYSGHDVKAGDTATLRLRPDVHISSGDLISRLSDAKQLDHARAHQPKQYPITMQASFVMDQEMQLTISDGQNTVTSFGSVAAAAQKRAATAADIDKQLSKLGDTPFYLADKDHLQIQIDGSLFLPVSELNALRRDAVTKLINERIHQFEKSNHCARNEITTTSQNDISLHESPISSSTLAVVFSDIALASELKAHGATMLIYEPQIFTPVSLNTDLSGLQDRIWLRIPPQLSQQTLQDSLSVLDKHQDVLSGLMLESVGHLGIKVPLPIMAGEGIPITNKQGMTALASSQAQGFVLWPEWTKSDQDDLMPMRMPCLLKMYGRESLMLLNHCPHRVAKGLSHNRADCSLCTNQDMTCGKEYAELVDRKGYHFPLQRTVFPEGCIISTLNSLPTNLSKYNDDRIKLGAGMLLHFTTEQKQEQLELTQAFSALLDGQTQFMPILTSVTFGHWARGVE